MHIPSTAREQVAAIKAGTLTAETLMAATYDRMEAVNGTLNAVVSVLPREEAMARARAADAKPNDGPLHGLPLAVKDLANAAGFPTTQGAPFFAEMTPVEDDLVIARLRGAGAVVFGKTNSPEFGLGSHTTNRLFGPTRNPYDPTRSAGGSSGGAGVALASGIVSIADGSDMMGSLRNPAVWNGVFGIRPTVGRVPRDPVGEAFLATLSTLGPMARDPLDLALLLDVMSGPDPRVPDAQPLDPVLPKLDAPLS